MDDQFAYQDFDLLIEPGSGGQYKARVLRSPAGESAPVQFAVPFSPVELENFVLKVGRGRRGIRGRGRPQSAPLKDFGGKLYDTVFQGELRDMLSRSISVASASGAGLRLRLRLADAPGLAGLPWEFLYDRRLNRFLAQSRRTPLVRYLDLPNPSRPLTVDGPLRLLVMISDPRDWPRLDVEQEWSVLTGALAQSQADGRVVIERITANMSKLRARLRREEFHVFHFIGHGSYRSDWGDGVLVMEDAEGGPHEVPGEEFGGLLNECDATRLAVLNACEGAISDASDPFAGVAQSLIQQGLPAVVAMQFEITDDASVIFARELYGAIADGYPVEAALTEARGAIRDEGNPTEWGTPVLYSRAPDGHLFDLTGRGRISKGDQNQAYEVPTAPLPPHRKTAHTEQGEDGEAPPSSEPDPIHMRDESDPPTYQELEEFDSLLISESFDKNSYRPDLRTICLAWLQVREREVASWIYRFRTGGLQSLHESLLELHSHLIELYTRIDRFCGGPNSYLAISKVRMSGTAQAAFDEFLAIWDDLPPLLQSYLLFARQHDAAYEQGGGADVNIDEVKSSQLRKALMERLNLLQNALGLLIDGIRKLLDA
jgi:hypothetical protein